MRSLRNSILAAVMLAVAPLSGCVVYEPVPYYHPGGSNYDRAWSAALGGARDVGVDVKSADRAGGRIYGVRNGIEVFVTVARQNDGSVRVHFNSRGPAQQDTELSAAFSRAFDRRMGN